ncbi:MAG: hypothetical protein K0S71_585 [Clostridia bacterium]|jgi:hypothetical protein|nr:hypothetical protein [Clostridia bacterium]
MQFRIKGVGGTWREVADACRTTINKDIGQGEPSDEWKRRVLMCEHSPIRKITIKGIWSDLPYWVSNHLVRHWLGIVHFVGTQRTDRTGVDRKYKSQDAPVIHEIDANAQALINISRKRLCTQAAPETREAWRKVLDKVAEYEPVIASVCVAECIYRGFCPEFKTCGYEQSQLYKEQLKAYRSGINGH